jgi:peptide-methionine (S)-S-oxide reductase
LCFASNDTFSCPLADAGLFGKGFVMPSSETRRRLPARPSQEHLRKLAKRLAKSENLKLAAAQRRLAADYGFANWAALMRGAENAASQPREKLPALSEAAARADLATVRDLLAQGAPADGERGEAHPPLWYACDGDAPAARRIAVANLLLDAGASPRHSGKDDMTPLHAAARRGPRTLVELLIRRGALSWQTDRRRRTPIDYARGGEAPDRDAIIELLDRPVIRDKRFRAAVDAIHAGDLAGLERLLDRHPELMRMRAVEPDCYPQDYFRDPKLFWFIANNPTLMRRMPKNIGAIGAAMIARGVAQEDLDEALGLVMSNGLSRAQSRQAELVTLLIEAGATATPPTVLVALAHRCVAPIRTLLDRGHPMTAPIAAALGRDRELASLLANAAPQERQEALALAVINRQAEAARLCLDAGADINAFLPVHKHSTPLHQASVNDDGAMLRLLVERGARLDTRDKLWNGTPLNWAVHTKKRDAEAYLRAVQEGRSG